MCNRVRRWKFHGAWTALLVAGVVSGQAALDSLVIKTIAEVEFANSTAGGRKSTHLEPADRLVSGDRVIYTLEVRNAGPVALDSPTIIHPIPPHTYYVGDSAVGPGSVVRYSVDGGHGFDRPENLRVTAADGATRMATAADYTHIRWQLTSRLMANSVAFVRFRVVVK